MREIAFWVVCGALLASIGAGSAAAEQITYEYTGTVTSADGIFVGQGSTVSGTFSYDTLLQASSSSSALAQQFLASENAALDASWEITMTIGSITRSTSSNPMVGDHHRLQVHDQEPYDSFQIATDPATSGDIAWIWLQDWNPGPPEGVLAGSYGLSSTPFTGTLDVSLFDLAQGSFEVYGPGDSTQSDIRFDLDSVTRVSPVPEPTTLALFGLGAGALALRRRKRRLA